jgi:DNA mismatch endonuclease (patch repair protein)
MKKKEKCHRSKAEQIHYTMSHIRSKDTKIEVMLRKVLWHSGIRYRKNFKALPGTPDIAITKYKIAVFCDGEFWHGKNFNLRKQYLHSNREFWISKIERNMKRDHETDLQLEHQGWYVLRFWGKEIEKNLDACVKEIKEKIIQVQVDSCNINSFYRDEDIDEGMEYAAAERVPEYGLSGCMSDCNEE